MSLQSSDKPDILIVTVTDIESNAVIEAFKEGTGRSFQDKPLRELFYFDLGKVGGAKIWMVRSGMGSEGPTGSTMTIQKAIQEVGPQVIIMVGIAFGIKQDEHKIGDILVSKQIVSYETQKIDATGIKPRGDRMPATAHLLQKFESSAQTWSATEKGVPVCCGLILSGNKLVNNLEFRSQLLVMEPEAIGGDMEGAGLSTAAYNNLVDWILIKAICDWADGNKDQDKQDRQASAAINAARFTYYVLKKGNISRFPKAFSEIPDNNSQIETVQAVDQQFLQKSVAEINQLLKSANYKLAAETGQKASSIIGTRFENDDPDIELLYGEFWVSYALASIYSGGESEGENGNSSWLNRVINRLEKRKSFYLRQDSYTQQRFHLILGRAYNHLGYSYWMDRGHYEAALSKFNKALECFTEGKWKQETATTYDNLARVYAQIGYRSQAEFLCNHGLKLREEYLKSRYDKENRYRHALSLNSSAIIHLTYGQSLRAYLESERALDVFEQCSGEKGERGVGLALITRSVASRMLGSHWQFTDDTKSSKEYLETALHDLLRAEEIFKRIDEDIRLIQVYNELGCVYREYCALYNKAGREEEARHAEKRSREFFRKILSVPENLQKYRAAFVDTYHDLAQTIYIISEGNDADIDKLEAELKDALHEAEKIIPEDYRFPSSSNPFVQPIEECFEDYWQYLGKIYALRGDLAFREISSFSGLAHQKQLRQEKIKEAFEFYILSTAYFNRYLERPIAPDNSIYPDELQRLEKYIHYSHNLYDRLSMLSIEEIRFVSTTLCQQVIDEFQLKPLWIDRFFKQSFDLLLRNSKIPT